VGRSDDHTTRGRRRLLVTALAFTGLGLFAAAGGLALNGRGGQERHLGRAAELERVLSVPSEVVMQPSDQRDLRELALLKVGPGAGSATQKDPSRVAHRSSVAKRMPAPAKILIPAIGASARIVPLGLNTNGTLEVPTSFSAAGWFRGAAEPGEAGPAIVVGHVDSVSGPGAFYHLRALRRNDVIIIVAKDGSTIRYTVTATLAAPKSDFPTKMVYGKTPKPTLRLVTCDGAFNSSTRHYVDNYIVFAKWAGTRRLH
jgi:sortase (surface protein transpeptidase)